MATAICTWFEFQYDRNTEKGKFVPAYPDEEPEQCRASIGDKIVTVWLPRGAKIRLRRSRVSPDELHFKHYYGRPGVDRKRIDIDIV